MRPIDFPQKNFTFIKPDSMTDEECGSLSVHKANGQIVSCWKMSWKERLSALLFGKAWVWIYGEGQPPIALEVTREIFKLVRKEKEDE